MKKMIKEHPICFSILISFILEVIWSLVSVLFTLLFLPSGFSGVSFFRPELMISIFMHGLVLAMLLVYPIVLTIVNFCMMIAMPIEEKMIRAEKRFEYITIILGVIYSGGLCLFSDIIFTADWTETLRNTQLHSPIWPESYPTVITLVLVGTMGYLILSWTPLRKMPPLVIVSSMAAMYLGTGECIFWIVQMGQAQKIQISPFFLCLLPFNCIIITIKTVRRKVCEWNQMEEHIGSNYESNRFLERLNRKLNKAENWPLVALILMLPLLGIIICILVLFGQRPDAAIKAWTETADWTLSQRIAPQNIMIDEHYLCTVAAGGHRKVVKPIRMGVRHGHRVTVNRQLCIANAFEQILEERLPCFHRRVRHFYDTYGFPVAKLIRSRYVADIVYFLMKPLEWIFLIVIYFCDVKPENRIAMQYLPVPK